MKMRRTCTSYIWLTLCAMLLLSSCDPQVRRPQEEQGTPPASSAAVDTPNAAQTGATQEDGEREPWHGDWIIEDYVLSPVSAWSEEEAQARLGQVVSYGKQTAISAGESFPGPFYVEEAETAQAFSDGYRGGLTFGDIWLDGEEARRVTVNNATFLGDSFYLRNENSLVIHQDGAFFLAERAGRSPEEESILAEACFDVWLNGWGDVRFVSSLPVEHEDVVFQLTRDSEIVYTFPAADDSDQGLGLVDGVEAVSFQDVDGDGQTDVIAIVNYATGADPQGMAPRPVLRIYRQDGRRFQLASALMARAEEYVKEAEGGKMTLDAVRACFGLNGV